MTRLVPHALRTKCIAPMYPTIHHLIRNVFGGDACTSLTLPLRKTKNKKCASEDKRGVSL